MPDLIGKKKKFINIQFQNLYKKKKNSRKILGPDVADVDYTAW